jgi:hypothetical protein
MKTPGIVSRIAVDLLARIMDAEDAGSIGGFVKVRNRVTNKDDADRMLRKWADLLGTHLQAARAGTTAK